MIIENEFTVRIPPDRALETLTDVPVIAPCLPGVVLTRIGEDGSYDGTAAVSLGPVALRFAGKARIEEINTEDRTARVTAEGADKKGRGRARADVSFRIVADGAGTKVLVRTDLALTGAVAQYGRASGLIKELARQITLDFSRNLEAQLDRADDTADGAATEAGGDAPPHDPSPPTAERPLSGLSLLWRVLVARIRRLFGPA